MRRAARAGLASLLVLLLVAGAAAGWGWTCAGRFLRERPQGAHEERIVEIQRGWGPQRVSRVLCELGVVTDARHFALFLQWRRATPGLRAGEYRFWTDQTPDEVLDVLLHAPEVTYSVTLAPGLRVEEMAARVEEAGRGSAARYVQLARDPAYVAGLGLSLETVPETLEGILVPETYSFPRKADEEDVIRAQVRRFEQIWDADRRARAAEIGRGPYEVTILASIVEKETAVPSERPLIAAVFTNRLRLGMRLESDPTIIYGLSSFDGNIRASDIRRPHRWNTYVIAGLPPTPIAAPGVEAIDAVLHPQESDALFFVSRNDGTHHFSETYAEHARMVRLYQR